MIPPILPSSIFLLDPKNITNFECSDDELELHILFWICAAGKNGVTSAKCLGHLLDDFSHGKTSPFNIIRNINDLANQLKNYGIGCYNNKSKSMLELVHSGIDLRNCSVEDLERIKGVGAKTARCFLIYTRPNQRFAGLDRHILQYMSDLGYDVPKSTPTGSKYRRIEQQFLKLADKKNKSIDEFDLEIWNAYRNGDEVAKKELLN